MTRIFKVNFAALLSAISEKMPELAYEVNVGGSKNMLDLGKAPKSQLYRKLRFATQKPFIHFLS